MTTTEVGRFEEAEGKLFASYGLDVRSRFVNLREPAMRARVLELGEGPPILFVIGGRGSASMWAPLWSELHGFHLYGPDRPGFGLSDGVNYRGYAPDRFRRHAVSFLASVLDACALERAAVVANSMGGLWSAWLAIDHPERVSALILVGCPALILDTSAPPPMRLLSVRGLNRVMWAMEKPSLKQATRTMKRMRHSKSVPLEFIDLFWRLEDLPDYRVAWLTLMESVLNLRGPRLQLAESELRMISAPTLVLWGISDPFGSPEVARRIVNAVPNASVEIVGNGHLPWLDDSAAAGRHIRTFLGRQ